MNLRRLFLLLVLVTPGLSQSEQATEQASEIASEFADICVKAENPGTCMTSYGFKCHQSRRHDVSLEAEFLGCNMPLADGRYQFVQMLYDDGGWAVENQHTYQPEIEEYRAPEEDAGLALSAYVRTEMKNYSTDIGGSGSTENLSSAFRLEIGTQRRGELIVVRAVCGAVIDTQHDERISAGTKADCEKNMLRTIRKLSQPQTAGAYSAAGAGDVEWTNKTVTLVSGNQAFVVDGHYRFAKLHKPCLWISECCSSDGMIYLDSCRAPTDSELLAVSSCLARGLQGRTDEFAGCLSEADVEVGCEDQPDGSRICY